MFICVDIETSDNHDSENPKTWIVSIQYYDGKNYYLLRRVNDFLTLLDSLIVKYKLEENEAKIVIYVHNLSFDLTYLIKWIVKHYNEEDTFTLLAVGSHKILTFSTRYFEWRCSWKLSNKSLLNWTNDLQVEHKKLDTFYDYTKILYPDSTLTEKEKEYDKTDVIGMYECIQKTLELHKDNILTVPLTSTGFVRREARRFFRKDVKNKRHFHEIKLTEDMYRIALQAYHGGYTHGNRFYKDVKFNVKELNKIVKNIQDTTSLSSQLDSVNMIVHRDETSFYPSRNRCKKFPMSKYTLYSNGEDITIDEILKYRGTYAFLIELDLYNCKIKEGVYFPILQSYKCISSSYKFSVEDENGKIYKFNTIDDNGRVLELQGGCRLCFTELELEFLQKQYTFKYKIVKSYRSKLGYIPEWLKKVTDYYYEGKSRLKDEVKIYVEKYGLFDKRTVNKQNELLKFKNGFNAIYGMQATRPIRPEVSYNMFAEDIKEVWNVKTKFDNMQEKLDDFYKNYNSFMPFQFGLYVTSLAQYELLKIFDIVGQQYVIYGDTDSMFYMSNEKIENKIDEYVQECYDNALKIGAYITVDGKKVLYDGMVKEEETILQFKFLHSKCYGYITKENGLQITVAGVAKRKLQSNCEYITREEELCEIAKEKSVEPLDALTYGTTFKKCGSKKSIYTYDKPHIEIIEGHEVDISDGCIISDSEYTIKDDEKNLDIEYIEFYELSFTPD